MSLFGSVQPSFPPVGSRNPSIPNLQQIIGTDSVSVIPTNNGAIQFAGQGISISHSGTSTLIFSIGGGGTSSITFIEDAGTAYAAGGVINILGSATQGLITSGTSNVVTITATDATQNQKGVVLLANNAQAVLGADTANSLTSAALAAKLGSQTTHGILIAEGTTNAFNSITLEAGQLPIGMGPSSDPVANTLTAGTNIGIGTSPGSITISCALAAITQSTPPLTTALGVNSLAINSGSGNTAVGYSALASNTDGTRNTAVGYSALNANSSGSDNTAIGQLSLVNNTSGNSNAAIGTAALHLNTTGNANVAVGVSSLFSNTDGNQNVAIGVQSLVTNTTGGNNTAVGYQTLSNLAVGKMNTAIGWNAGFNCRSNESNNIFLGSNVTGITGDSNVTWIGNGSVTKCFISGIRGFSSTMNDSSPVVIDSAGQLGSIALSDGQLLIGATGTNPVAARLGEGSGIMITNGSGSITISATTPAPIGPLGQVFIGSGISAAFNSLGVNSNLTAHGILLGQGLNALTATILQPGQILIGSNPGSDPVANTLTAGTNIGIGTAPGTITISNSLAATTQTTPPYKTAFGFHALADNTAIGNTAVGYEALLSNTSGYSNTAIGYGALYHNNTGGNNNTALGTYALFSTVTGSNNTAVGAEALLENISITGGNSAFGHQALKSPLSSTGYFNSAFGYQALTATSGRSNTAVGCFAGKALTTGSHNTVIGYDAQLSPNTSNTILIGTGTVTQTCIIDGIYNRPAGSPIGLPVHVDQTGLLGTQASSIRFKENIESLGEESKAIYDLHPVTFNYKNYPTKDRSIGLIAEEVDKALPSLVIYDQEGRPETVKYHHLPCLMLKEMQAQQQEIAKLTEELTTLKSIVSRLSST